ncbi:MAG: zinc transporter ZupT [Clostridia bacterium]
MDNVFFAFAMTLIAGLCTGIGSLIAFVSKKDNKVFLSVSLGFSAGVMIYVSMIEIFVKAQESLVGRLGDKNGAIITVVSFFGGMILIALIDKIIPSVENPHEMKHITETVPNNDKSKLMRMGLFTALAIGIHNFPEGLATFISAMQEPEIAIPIVVAIALHNIPEGIAVSVPVYHATGSKKKAFIYSFLSGLSEPVGALIGWLILMPIMNDVVFGVIFGAVAGIMVFISIDELLPCAREYGKHHHSIYGFVAGMMVMAISLIMFI